MAKGTCSICGREEGHLRRGMCHAHYERWRTTGDAGPPQVPLPPKSRPRCSVEGCREPARARGWCPTHYQRWRMHGDPLHARPASCTVEGCDSPVHGHGLCDKHYQRWKKWGDVLAYNRSIPLATCIVEGCDKPPGSGTGRMCKMHYTRLQRHGDPLVTRPNRLRDDQVNYFQFHDRIRKARGKATGYECVMCGAPAREWAWIHGTDDRDISNYMPLCHGCHRRYDAEYRRRSKEVGDDVG